VPVLYPPAPPPPNPPDPLAETPPAPPPATTKYVIETFELGVTELVEELVEDPLVFVAVTVNVYAVPLVNPVTVTGDAPDAVTLPGLDVTVYVVAAPPVFPAVYVTVAEVFPAVAVPIVGVCGFVLGVNADDVKEFDVLKLFVAVIPKVYWVEFVSPLIIIGEDVPV
jgi:hypothetical protein